MTDLSHHVIELNLLGSSILKEDGFFNVSNKLKNIITSVDIPRVKKSAYNDEELLSILEKTVVNGVGGKKAVLLLSGGVDSTLIAHLLKKNNIDFESWSYFLDEKDPSIEKVKYVEEHLDIKSSYVFCNQNRVRQIWDNYFDIYKSPNMDYGALLTADLLCSIATAKSNLNEICLIDGVGADDVFGCEADFLINDIKALLHVIFSNSITRPLKFKYKKLNIYTSSLLKHTYATTTYQNFVFGKIIHKRSIKEAIDYLSLISLKLGSVSNSAGIRSGLFNLYYGGRRVAYKTSGYANPKFEVFYPFLQQEIINYGFSLHKSLKISPVLKEPLKRLLSSAGFDKRFVYSDKVGFGFDLFKILNKDEALESLTYIDKVIPLNKGAGNYIYKLMKQDDKAIDHFLFGLMMSRKFIHKYS